MSFSLSHTFAFLHLRLDFPTLRVQGSSDLYLNTIYHTGPQDPRVGFHSKGVTHSNPTNKKGNGPAMQCSIGYANPKSWSTTNLLVSSVTQSPGRPPPHPKDPNFQKGPTIGNPSCDSRSARPRHHLLPRPHATDLLLRPRPPPTGRSWLRRRCRSPPPPSTNPNLGGAATGVNPPTGDVAVLLYRAAHPSTATALLLHPM
jgi:hypothetical protein